MPRCTICSTETTAAKLTEGICDECLAAPPAHVPTAVAPRPSPPTIKAPTKPKADIDPVDGEEVLLREGEIIVTRTRCMMPSRTIFVGSISNVETKALLPNKSAVLLLTLLAAVCVAGLIGSVICLSVPSGRIVGGVIGVLSVGVGALCIRQLIAQRRPRETSWSVRVVTSVGPVEIVRSLDRMVCERVASAINRAMTIR